MTQENTYKDFEALVARYLSGNASPHEVAQLEEWVKNDPECKAAFSEIRKNWRNLSALDQGFDSELAWQKVREEIQIETSPLKTIALKRERQFLNVWKIAAALIVLIVGFYSVYYFTQLRELTFVAEQPASQLNLQDGSQIIANAGASLRYPVRFSVNQRRVSLEGEAFFRVEHHHRQTFVVEAHGLEIRVLGTSFLVKANRQSEVVEVMVESGKVALSLPEKPELILHAGQSGIYNRAHQSLQLVEQKDSNILSWKTRVMYFEKTPLDEVFRVIGNTYGLSFMLEDPMLSQCTLTATFREKSLEDVLTIVAETFSLRYIRARDTLKVRGVPCHPQP